MRPDTIIIYHGVDSFKEGRVSSAKFILPDQGIRTVRSMRIAKGWDLTVSFGCPLLTRGGSSRQQQDCYQGGDGAGHELHAVAPDHLVLLF